MDESSHNLHSGNQPILHICGREMLRPLRDEILRTEFDPAAFVAGVADVLKRDTAN
jgi:hypothetical protein